MFLLNNMPLEYEDTEIEDLQYKMFLLNTLGIPMIRQHFSDLQYKMFLLNKSSHKDVMNYLQIYNTKCFY